MAAHSFEGGATRHCQRHQEGPRPKARADGRRDSDLVVTDASQRTKPCSIAFPGAARETATLDLTASLVPEPAGNGVIRNALAVLSNSQVNA